MADVTAGYHVGLKADDTDAQLRRAFADRANQQDGLATILKYCQDKSGYRPGNTDPSGFLSVLQAEFPNVVTIKVNPTTFMQYLGPSSRSMPSINDLVNHLPDNSKLLTFLRNIPEYGSYNRSIVQLFTELEGDYLSFYTVQIGKYQDDDETDESVSFTYHSVDRDEMARRADELVDKLRVKERLDDWANGISSDGYKN
ncbi:hypothetical protein EMPS_03784 [Entomortierella parvispora]|uniref:Uncharacterized protein n=1 Tax=Entomortierella parvispora TaxID=205924 RepID=A0A9P3H7E4_9FUNG|nr:hypothetical protein EMPS_03784 [Entomortierella parvispora]